ncbi:hypothetical protein TCAL_11970 [Tigriopus californicus]|uniref:CHK kinase-like domain-containing protein n=2 Tax=Tigriopus californicus TaxID=6832 RepID=A0A553P3C6_TIGCA|nr:hypothetical protein TCAL_11970 [Tigriopus californicus]|eukprot:TCALIF_11970-PA protein Name:"Protein of unknown function" AED:0.02 eAED:0.02 QI:78/1/0.66/1/1/1/3/97/439
MFDHKALTKEKFVEIIGQRENTKDVKLVQIDLESGAEKGQNYSGQVVSCHLEAQVNGKSKTYKWMAKVPLDDPDKYDFLRMLFMEQKELGFYQELLPALHDLIAKRGAKIDLKFCPFVYGEFKQNIPRGDCVHGSMIMMEHLGPMGFTEPKAKRSGLDLDHVKLVMKSLGEFHGASHVYYKYKHDGLDQIVEKEPIQAKDYMSDPKMAAIMEPFSAGMIQSFYNALSSSGPKGDKYLESYRQFSNEKIDPCKLRDQLTRPDVCRFNVLCHGDPWFNNILFKYDGNKPSDVCFVDLALTKWASPTIDLSYFLFLSTTPDLRKAHMSDILKCYHDSLTLTLKSLDDNPTPFSLTELIEDYRKCSFFGFMMAMLMLPMILANKADVLGSEEFTGDFSDPKVIEEMNKLSIERAKITMAKDPLIGHRISCSFLEMVDYGYFTL